MEVLKLKPPTGMVPGLRRIVDSELEACELKHQIETWVQERRKIAGSG